MAANPSPESLAQQAKFVFRGTLRKLKASTMSELQPDESTGIVRVDQIVQAPPVLSSYLGKDITVRLAGKRKMKPGQEAVFYANGWRFGDGIAVQALDQLPTQSVQAAHGQLGAEGSVGPVETLADRELKKHVEDADAIVSGRVKSVSVVGGGPRAPRQKMGAGTTGVPLGQRISEHDPLWHDAVVEVQQVHKGSKGTKQVVVRFPRSTDVRWYRAPKFKPGDEGVFVLRRPKAPAAGARAAVGGAEPKANLFTVEHHFSFQPPERAEKIRKFLQSPATGGAGSKTSAAAKKRRRKT